MPSFTEFNQSQCTYISDFSNAKYMIDRYVLCEEDAFSKKVTILSKVHQRAWDRYGPTIRRGII